MTHSLTGHFDGQFIVLDEPVQLPVGQPLRIRVELVEPSPPRFAELLRLASDLPDAPPDLSVQHDHYLYGAPKR
jgi:hypothetical protein